MNAQNGDRYVLDRSFRCSAGITGWQHQPLLVTQSAMTYQQMCHGFCVMRMASSVLYTSNAEGDLHQLAAIVMIVARLAAHLDRCSFWTAWPHTRLAMARMLKALWKG